MFLKTNYNPNIQKIMPIKPIFKKGDRVLLTNAYERRLGPGSEGIVMKDVYYIHNSVAVDFVRAHDSNGNKNINSWSGHDCQGLIPRRNDRYYGFWIDASRLKKLSSISDEDILLLI